MSRLCLGFLAHVDSGKTTLSEAVLYKTGAIRKAGRVDHGDAFLDTEAVEKNRGITVYSKEARFCIAKEPADGGQKGGAKGQAAGRTGAAGKDDRIEVCLIDTPGHKDFVTEAEKCLPVLDYAVLIISAPDMIQEQTEAIWRLLRIYRVPTIIFVNKMDRAGTERAAIMEGLKKGLGDGVFEIGEDGHSVTDYEDAAVGSDELTEEFFADGTISDEHLKSAVSRCEIFPVFFGSALKDIGIEEFLRGIAHFTIEPKYGLNFSAKTYKITRDRAGNRLTHMKITGGSLKVKQMIEGEKVDQIRLINGGSFTMVREAEAGEIVAVTGPQRLTAGREFVSGKKSRRAINFGDRDENLKQFRKLEVLNEEDPTLDLFFDELRGEIHLDTMGEGSLEEEILAERLMDRFGLLVKFTDPAEYVPPDDFWENLTEGEDGYFYDDEGNAFDAEGNPVEPETEEERERSFALYRLGSEETRREEKNLDRIFRRTYGESKRDAQLLREAQARATRLKAKEKENDDEDRFPEPNRKGSKGNTHLIIDGYNVIFAWEELRELSEINFDAARELLLEILQNYQGYRKTGITCVFDGYKSPGNPGTEYDLGTVHVVYTREGQTADRYIEEMIFEMGRKYDLTAVTSDRPVQMAAIGDGAKRMPVREFRAEVLQTSEEIREKLKKQRRAVNRPFEGKL